MASALQNGATVKFVTSLPSLAVLCALVSACATSGSSTLEVSSSGALEIERLCDTPKDLALVRLIASGEKTIPCDSDSICPCGSACFAGNCTAECVTTEDPVFGCPIAGEICDNAGRCAPPQEHRPIIDSTFTMRVAPNDILLPRPTTAGAEYQTTELAIALTSVNTDAEVPEIKVAGGLDTVPCPNGNCVPPTGSTLEVKCLPDAAFAASCTTKGKHPTVWVRPTSQAALNTLWKLNLNAPAGVVGGQAVVTLQAPEAASVEAHYFGNALVVEDKIRVPIEVYIKNQSALIVDPSRILCPTGSLVVPINASAKQSYKFLQSPDMLFDASVTVASFEHDKLSGTIAAEFHALIENTGATQTWKIALRPEEALPANCGDCGHNFECAQNFNACVPQGAPVQAELVSLVDRTLRALTPALPWLNAKTETADNAERLMCMKNESADLASAALGRELLPGSKDLRCLKQGPFVSPLANFGKALDMRIEEAIKTCTEDLQREPSSSLEPRNCIDVSRMLGAIGSLTSETDRRTRTLREHLLKQWLMVHTFVAHHAIETWLHDGTKAGHKRETLSGLLDLAQRAWALVPTDLEPLEDIDYRVAGLPVGHWPEASLDAEAGIDLKPCPAAKACGQVELKAPAQDIRGDVTLAFTLDAGIDDEQPVLRSEWLNVDLHYKGAHYYRPAVEIPKERSFKHFKSVTWLDCMLPCAVLTQCQAWSRDAANTCYLTDNLDNLVPSTKPNTLGGILRYEPGKELERERVPSRFFDLAFAVYPPWWKNSPHECQLHCEEDANCSGWTFNAKDNNSGGECHKFLRLLPPPISSKLSEGLFARYHPDRSWFMSGTTSRGRKMAAATKSVPGSERVFMSYAASGKPFSQAYWGLIVGVRELWPKCLDLCRSEPRCVQWSQLSGSGYCNLYDHVGPLVPVPGVVSGEVERTELEISWGGFSVTIPLRRGEGRLPDGSVLVVTRNATRGVVDVYLDGEFIKSASYTGSEPLDKPSGVLTVYRSQPSRNSVGNVVLLPTSVDADRAKLLTERIKVNGTSPDPAIGRLFGLTDAPKSTDPQAVSVAVAIADALDSHVRLATHYLELEAAAQLDKCIAKKPSTLPSAVQQAGDALRTATALEPLLSEAVARAPKWVDDLEAAMTRLGEAKRNLANSLVLVSQCKNPLNIEETDLPLYFPPDAQPSYFASSTFLFNKATTAISEAAADLEAAQNAWVQAREGRVRDASNASSTKVEELRLSFDRELNELCGMEGTNALAAFDTGEVSPETCFVSKANGCLKLHKAGDLVDVPGTCYRGALGQSIVGLQTAYLEADRADLELQGLEQRIARRIEICAMLPEQAKVINEHHEYLATLRKRINRVSKWRRRLRAITSIGEGVANFATSGNPVPLLTSGMDTSFGNTIDKNRRKIEEEEAKYQKYTALFENELKQRECADAVEILRNAILVQELTVETSVSHIDRGLVALELGISRVRDLVASGNAAIARAQAQSVPQPHLSHWVDRAIERYKFSFRWAKRLAYLAMRAHEYESQSTLSLRGDILTAGSPSDLRNALNGISQEQTFLVCGKRPVPKFVVFKLSDLLGIEGDVATRRNELRNRLANFGAWFTDPDGTIKGNGVPIHLLPGMGAHWKNNQTVVAMNLMAGQRIDKVTVALDVDKGDDDKTPKRPVVELFHRNTFGTSWCKAPPPGAPPMRMVSYRPSKNLFNPTDLTSSGFDEATAFQPAVIQSVYYDDTLYDDSFDKGTDAGLAGRGLFGEFWLVFPLNSGLDFSRLNEVYLRFDYRAVPR